MNMCGLRVLCDEYVEESGEYTFFPKGFGDKDLVNVYDRFMNRV